MYRNDISDADIIRASNTCVSAAEAARKLGINYKTYRSRAIKLGVFKTNQPLKGVNKYRPRKYNVDDNAFDVINNESAYFMGFLAADGSIVGNTLRVMIQARDVDILEELLAFLKSDYQIGYCESHYKDKTGYIHYFDAAYIRITSKHIVESLARYGIVQGKKYKDIDFLAKIPDEYKVDFIVGILDGDGGVYCKDNQVTIHMALNKNTCKSISKLLSDMNIRYTVGVRDKIDVLYISNFDGIVKFSKLYLEASSRHAVLSRKRDKFMDILGT